MFENQDDSFFIPVPSKNLASLFEMDMTESEAIPTTSTLTYTAPKQPPKNEEASTSDTKVKYPSSVILFKEVYAFKLIENNYISQGKCGLTLVGNDSVRVYQLLLYRQRNDIISSIKLSNNFHFIVQKDNYASFVDEQKLNWTVHFNTDADIDDFQQTIESRGGKVFNATQLISPVEETIQPLNKEDTLLQLQLENDNQSEASIKTDILVRMAKMGQKLLPSGNSVSDGTDSEVEKEKTPLSKNRKKRVVSNAVSFNKENESEKHAHKSPDIMMPIPVRSQFAFINGQYMSLPHFPESDSASFVCSPVFHSQQLPHDQFHVYFAENRTHNSEVRMSLFRLSSKVEELLDHVLKIDNKTSTIKSNDTTIKLLTEENELLKFNLRAIEQSLKTCEINEQQRSMEYVEKERALMIENENLKKSLEKFEEREYGLIQKVEKLESKLREIEKTVPITDNYDKFLVDKRKYESINADIKKIMNNLYREVKNNFQDDGVIDIKETKKILMQQIVNSAYNIVSVFKELDSTSAKESDI